MHPSSPVQREAGLGGKRGWSLCSTGSWLCGRHPRTCAFFLPGVWEGLEGVAAVRFTCSVCGSVPGEPRGQRRGSSTRRPLGCREGCSGAVVSGVDFEGAGATAQPVVTQLPTELGPAGCKEAAAGAWSSAFAGGVREDDERCAYGATCGAWFSGFGRFSCHDLRFGQN